MMNLKESIKNYVINMIKNNGDSMKVLILDDETLKIVNAVFSMSEIMKYEVYLCEKISLKREKLPYLNCICFLRPTVVNVSLLEKELRNPNYKSYNIYFSHTIAKQQLKVLAEADQLELVMSVHEYFADFQPMSQFFWQVGVDKVLTNGEWQTRSLGRCVESVTALLLALKICPEIRYQNSSEAARRLAEQTRGYISREAALYEFRQTRSSLLLILDRRLDPVTPLLNQWTYQAMIHELLNVEDGCVKIIDNKENCTQINLDVDRDDFYHQNLYCNYGEVCTNVKCAMEQLQSKSKNQEKMESIEDMKRFIETYPSFKKLSTKISQHVLIISEMSKLVGSNKLLSVSECEQNVVNGGGQLTTDGGHGTCLQMIKTVLGDTQVKKHDALRLVLLYALRYDKHQKKETSNLMTILIRQCGVTETEIQSLRMVMEYGSIKATDLFKERNNSLAGNIFKTIKGDLDIENIYTQHQPYLGTLVEAISQGKLKESFFPALGGCQTVFQKPSDVLIFVIGGVTYEEALCMHNANQQIQGINFILGGTKLINYRSFLGEITAWAGESFSMDKF